jgi:hypothetical protein
MYSKNIHTLLLSLGLIITTGAHAESLSGDTASTPSKIVNPAAQAPAKSYSYAYAGPIYSRPIAPYLNRQAYNNRSRHRFNGRNDWFGDNRMRHWNRTMTNVISDMLGDGAGDFEFDMNIKFKAKGKGKGRGKSRADARARQSYDGDYRGNVRGRGNYYGSGNANQYSRYWGYGHTPYYTYRYTYRQPATYSSYPPVITSTLQQEGKKQQDRQ